MTEDQNEPSYFNRRQRDGVPATGSASGHVPDTDRDDTKDLRDLFRLTAPSCRRVDVEAILSAIQARQLNRRLAWSRLVGQLRDTLDRRAVSETPRKSPFWKRGLAVSVPLAATVAVAAGVAALLMTRESAANVTLAEVQSKVEETRTVTCKVTQVTAPTPRIEDRSYRLLIRGPNLVRSEGHDGGYTITDYNVHKTVSVEPKTKSARITEGMNLPTLNFYEIFRSIAANPTQTLAPRGINGKQAVGFIVRPPTVDGVRHQADDVKVEITVWVDPQTKLPLQIETTSREQGGVTVTQVYSEIVFDGPFDAAIFNMAPPEAYRVESLGVAKLQPETAPKDMTELVVTPGIGIGPVRFGMKATDVIQLLGPPDKVLNPVKGMDVLEYYSRGFSITARDGRGVLMITCFTGKFLAVKVRDFAGRTDKGIRMGAHRAAIEKEYGPPSSVREVRKRDVLGKRAVNPDQKTGHVHLSYETLRVSFTLQDDSLASIMLRAPQQAR
jgi:outer membrane lipoprotein-sorting protein